MFTVVRESILAFSYFALPKTFIQTEITCYTANTLNIRTATGRAIVCMLIKRFSAIFAVSKVEIDTYITDVRMIICIVYYFFNGFYGFISGFSDEFRGYFYIK